MDRLQKKCFIASAGFHLLLAGILLVGPGFLASSSKTDNTPILDVIPSKVIDAAFSGGGTPNVKPPPPMPPQTKQEVPPPKPESQPHREVKPPADPPKQVVQDTKPELPDKPDPDSLETTKEKRKKLPQISLTQTVRKQPSARKQPSESTETDNRKQQLAYQQKINQVFGTAARTLRDDLSTGISLETPGTTGGEAYASYDQVVRSVYYNAWIAPDDTSRDDGIVKATVTIASEGNVLSAHILRGSGDAGVDRSVQATLDRVTFVHEFPAGAKEKQRTYTINFNLKAKRLSP